MAVRQAEKIPAGKAKERFVKHLFATIAPNYDFMNLLMSAGTIYFWHRAFRRRTGLSPGDRALDVCTGTGELALLLAGQVGETGVVHGLDLTPEMLDLARGKIERRGLGDRVRLDEGNALAMPYPDDTFNAVSMGFALRNVVDIPGAVREMTRVARPGGTVLTLELSKPASPVIRYPFFFYFYRVVPVLGRLFDRTGGRIGTMRPYTYLPASLVKFPDQETVAGIFRDAGLVDVRCHPLTGGIVTLHVGRKPA